jgi:hypothetical protein
VTTGKLWRVRGRFWSLAGCDTSALFANVRCATVPAQCNQSPQARSNSFVISGHILMHDYTGRLNMIMSIVSICELHAGISCDIPNTRIPI